MTPDLREVTTVCFQHNPARVHVQVCKSMLHETCCVLHADRCQALWFYMQFALVSKQDAFVPHVFATRVCRQAVLLTSQCLQ